MTAPTDTVEADARVGRGIIRSSLAGTVLLLVATAVAAAFVDVVTIRVVHVVVSVLLFLAGTGVFLWAYAIAVNRSRTDNIGIGGLYFLAGTAPAGVRRLLLGALTAQTVIAFAGAFVRPFTSLAFGILAPVFGLGLCGLWAARHGTFGPRPTARRR